MQTHASSPIDAKSIDVAHEALVRNWPRLRQWLDEDRIGVQTHQRLTEAAHEWDHHIRDASYVYRDARLRTVRTWAKSHGDDLSQLEKAFIQSSLAAQWRRRMPTAVGGMVVLALTVTVLCLMLTESGPFVPGIAWEAVAKFGGQEITGMAWAADGTMYVASLARNDVDVSSLSRTTDVGATWTDLELPETSKYVSALLLDPRDADSIYIGIYTFGLYRSSDAGGSWQAVASPLSSVDDLAMSADGMLFAGSARQSGLYASEDGGTTWAHLATCPDAKVEFLDWKDNQLLVGMSGGLWGWTRSRGCVSIAEGLGPVYAAVIADDVIIGSEQGLYCLPAAALPIHVLESRINTISVLSGRPPLYIAGTTTGLVLRWHGTEARERRIPFAGSIDGAEYVSVINVQHDRIGSLLGWNGTRSIPGRG